jgi:hypothetical protein
MLEEIILLFPLHISSSHICGVALNVQKRREDTPKNGGGDKVEKNYMFKRVNYISSKRKRDM